MGEVDKSAGWGTEARTARWEAVERQPAEVVQVIDCPFEVGVTPAEDGHFLITGYTHVSVGQDLDWNLPTSGPEGERVIRMFRSLLAVAAQDVGGLPEVKNLTEKGNDGRVLSRPRDGLIQPGGFPFAEVSPYHVAVNVLDEDADKWVEWFTQALQHPKILEQAQMLADLLTDSTETEGGAS